MEVRLLRAAVEDEPARAFPLTALRAPTRVAELRAEKQLQTARQASGQNAAEPSRRIAADASVVLPHVADSTYYTAREIDVYPSLLAPLAFEKVAAAGTIAREALVRLRVDELGRLTHFVVLQADPEGASEEALRIAFSAAKFSAARRNGSPVKSEIVVRVVPGSHAAATEAELDIATVDRSH